MIIMLKMSPMKIHFVGQSESSVRIDYYHLPRLNPRPRSEHREIAPSPQSSHVEGLPASMSIIPERLCHFPYNIPRKTVFMNHCN